MKLKLSLFVASLLTITTIFAQEKPTEWTLLKSSNGVTIEYKYQECKNVNYGFDRENVILRATNTTNEVKIASWSLESFRGGICTTCNKNNEYDFELLIKPNRTLEGNCSAQVDPRLKIFSKFLIPEFQLEKDNLTSFELTKFTVKKQDLD